MDNKYMTTCKTCGKEVAKNARTCPHCGARMPAQNPNFLGWMLIIFIIGLVLRVIGQSMMY